MKLTKHFFGVQSKFQTTCQSSGKLCQMFDPGDFAQLCLEAVCMHSFN